MKLISCYIEGFGAIKQRDYTFSEGVNTFLEDNGSGKSTLAAFIKAMLYSFDTARQNQKDFSDRVHYYPFEGGAFGGNLVFEWRGDTYKIERFFDVKSAVKDTLTVYKNNERFEGLGDDIGRTIFGIDKRSFERTAFLDSSEVEIESTEGINEKLGTFLHGTQETRLSDALDTLDTAAKDYQKRSPTAKIRVLENEINELKSKIRNLESKQEALVVKNTELDAKTRELARLERVLKAYDEIELVRKDYETYERLVAELDAMRKDLEALAIRYPKGLPDDATIKAIREALQEEKTLKAKADVPLLNEEETMRLSRYQLLFKEDVPTREQLDLLEQDAKSEAECSHTIALYERKTLNDKERALLARLDGKVPSEDELAKMQDAASRYQKTERELREAPEMLVREGSAKKGFGGFKWLAVPAALLLVLGLAMLFVQTVVGVALTVLGAIGLFVVAFLYLNQKASGRMPEQYENPRRAELLSTLRSLEDPLKSFLIRLGYYTEAGVSVNLANLQNDLREYERLATQEKKNREELMALCAKKQALVTKISASLAPYGMVYSGDDRVLRTLRSSVEEYRSLGERLADEKTRREKIGKQLAAISEVLDAFKAKYALDSVDGALLDQLSHDLAESLRLAAAISDKDKAAKDFFKAKKLSVKPESPTTDVESDRQNAAVLRQSIATLRHEIELSEAEVETLSEDRAELARKNELLEVYKHRHTLLTAAKSFLENADKAMKERFVKPVKDEFLKHAALLEKTLGERVIMDHAYKIRFERSGKERSDKHLSSGQRSVCAFAFRLALLEKMYETEKPFLVLDDPFALLDDVHFKKMADLLRTLGESTQILYFTCHESRNI